MRIIIVGASPLGVDLARFLIRKGDEIVLIERNSQKAKEISETLDCTVIEAEGTRPDILEKAEISKANAIVACTDHDQDNILIGLIARTLNVPEIIIKTDYIQFQSVAKKLGFRHVVNPSQTTSVIISDALRGVDTIELSTLIRGEVKFPSVIIGEKQAGKKLYDIKLTKRTAYIGLYRDHDFILHTENPTLQPGDEILFVTLEETKDQLCEMFCDIKPPVPTG